MPILNFGQPLDGIIQTAFVVEDIRKEMDTLTRHLGIGPWFLRERGRFAVQTYRGQPTEVELAIAMGYCGSMQYELIQQLNDVPSVYMDVVKQRGYGLHHFGYAVNDYRLGCAKYRDAGYELVYEAEVTGGAKVGYFDTLAVLPAMVEVIQMTPASEANFTKFYHASVGWDGSDPVRLREPLPAG
ncbi:MAG: VOC family protein [Beijerinckiaceae bacterium]